MAVTDEKNSEEGRVRRSNGFVDEVFDLIRADIMSLKIPPDTRIPIGSLVRELGVSQTPIREALSMLEVTGLVTKKQFVGYCTAPKLNRRQFDELFEMRLLIEPFAARRAAEKISDQELTEICALAHEMEPGETRASYDLFADQDAELHERIARASGNALIEGALKRLHVHLHIFRLRFHSEVTTEAYSEHSRLIDALVRRSPAEAEAAMSFHIERSYARLVPFADI
ncbi:MAG TPA: GntR family transcriptional regulator [Sphingobium sp.]|nr:GntR family transcriptional regulator [Sphingobium sp.]